MTKILFICHGNICRSPMAEFIMKKLLKDRGLEKEFYIESAATTREEIGNDIYPPAKRKLLKEGIPFNSRRARIMTKSDYDNFDYIIGMDQENKYDLKDFYYPDDEKKLSQLLDWTVRKGENVADPWYTGNFEITYDDLIEGCQGIIDKLVSK